MLGPARREIIEDLINTQGTVVVSELADRFDLTEETIRKDLKRLEEKGVLKRIYGGAVRVNVHKEVDVNVREKLLIKDKELIGTTCANFIDTYDTVFFDGSTTAYFVAKAAIDKPRTVITNSLMIADLFAESNKTKLILVGGNFDPSRRIFLGKTTEDCLKLYRFNKTFISCEYIHLQHGITDANESRALVRRMAIQQAEHAYLVVDNTKFNGTAPYFISPLDSISTLVTNKPISETWRSGLKQNKIEYVVADDPNQQDDEIDVIDLR